MVEWAGRARPSQARAATALAVSEQHRFLLSSSWDRTVRVWDLDSLMEVARRLYSQTHEVRRAFVFFQFTLFIFICLAGWAGSI